MIDTDPNPPSAPTWACCHPVALLALAINEIGRTPTPQETLVLFNYGYLQDGAILLEQAAREVERAMKATQEFGGSDGPDARED